MSEWIMASTRPPESESLTGECAKYYLVQINGFGEVRAMFLNGEWYTSYIAKIIYPVIYWLDPNGTN
jgi:hypothetical protein